MKTETVYNFLAEKADRRSKEYKLLDKYLDNLVKQFSKESKEVNDFFNLPLAEALQTLKVI